MSKEAIWALDHKTGPWNYNFKKRFKSWINKYFHLLISDFQWVCNLRSNLSLASLAAASSFSSSQPICLMEFLSCFSTSIMTFKINLINKNLRGKKPNKKKKKKNSYNFNFESIFLVPWKKVNRCEIPGDWLHINRKKSACWRCRRCWDCFGEIFFFLRLQRPEACQPLITNTDSGAGKIMGSVKKFQVLIFSARRKNMSILIKEGTIIIPFVYLTWNFLHVSFVVFSKNICFSSWNFKFCFCIFIIFY